MLVGIVPIQMDTVAPMHWIWITVVEKKSLLQCKLQNKRWSNRIISKVYWIHWPQRRPSTVDWIHVYIETNGHLVSSSTWGAAGAGTPEQDQGYQPGCWRWHNTSLSLLHHYSWWFPSWTVKYCNKVCLFDIVNKEDLEVKWFIYLYIHLF